MLVTNARTKKKVVKPRATTSPVLFKSSSLLNCSKRGQVTLVPGTKELEFPGREKLLETVVFDSIWLVVFDIQGNQFGDEVKLSGLPEAAAFGCFKKQAAGSDKPVLHVPLLSMLESGLKEGKIPDKIRRPKSAHANTKFTTVMPQRITPSKRF